MNLYFQKLTPEAIIPSRGSNIAAGLDLSYSREKSIVIPPQSRRVIPIDVACYGEVVGDAMYGSSSEKNRFYLRIAPRSGLAAKSSIDVGAGVIDEDYRGNIQVVLINNSLDTPFEVTQGMRIAQLITERVFLPRVIVCDKLPDSQRGSDGFGSTGV